VTKGNAAGRLFDHRQLYQMISRLQSYIALLYLGFDGT